MRVSPDATVFKPRGIPAGELEWVRLGAEELEAIRLMDREGMYQEQAAESMGVSRATFARILDRGRRKVAEALLCGKALEIDVSENHEKRSSER